MKQKTYIQLSLFNESDYNIKHDHSSTQTQILSEVISYFISINESTDPVWWGCRWSEMVVYTERINPAQKSEGCMSKEYPFNVWEFVKQANKDEFIRKGIAQAKSKTSLWFNH